MEITIKKDSDITIVYPSGRVDTLTAKNFEEGIMKIISDNKKIIISFSEISYISSAGLRVILVAGKKIASMKGQLALADMSEKIYEIFKMSGFDKILKIYPTYSEARSSFDK
ncbi:MAG: STAS domain-containing protein [Alphaproteobacteria bacterium]|nr:STAS domain-containing protein [Alphaproteobacteria bacterium]